MKAVVTALLLFMAGMALGTALTMAAVEKRLRDCRNENRQRLVAAWDSREALAECQRWKGKTRKKR